MSSPMIAMNLQGSDMLNRYTAKLGESRPSTRYARPEWNSASDHVDTFRETMEEKVRRAATHTSKNLRAAQRDLEERKVREGLNRLSSRPSTKSKSIVKETITSMEEIEELLAESDRVVGEARTLLAQHFQSAISASPK